MKILNGIRKVERWIVVIGLAVMTVITAYAVFNRFVLKDPLQWSEEATRYIFIWVSLIGASIAVEENLHVNVNLFVDMFPKNIRKKILTIANIICVLFCVVLVYTGVQLVIAQSHQLSPSLRINMAFVYSAIPVSFTLMAINFAENIVKISKEEIFETSKDEQDASKYESKEVLE